MKALLALLSFTALPVMAATPSVTPQSIVKWILVLIGVGIIVGLLYLLIDKAPFIPAEFKTGLKYLLLFLIVVLVIGVIMSLIGYPIF